jgi:O-antigen ligase
MVPMRPKIVRMGLAILLLITLIFAWNPDLGSRPALEHTLTARRLTADESLRWRMAERWPYFWKMALENPWLGRGTDVARELGTDTNTPHNGYLSLAVAYGIPATLVFMGFIVLGVRDGVRLYFSGESAEKRLIGLAVATSILGLALQNVGDTSLTLAPVVAVFWMILGIGTVLAREAMTERSLASRRLRASRRETVLRSQEVFR